jgi:hypothetical protein
LVEIHFLDRFFASGLKVSKTVSASEAVGVGAGEVGACESLCVKPGSLTGEIADEGGLSALGGNQFGAEALDLSFVDVSTLALVDGCAEIVAAGSGGLEVFFDFFDCSHFSFRFLVELVKGGAGIEPAPGGG